MGDLRILSGAFVNGDVLVAPDIGDILLTPCGMEFVTVLVTGDSLLTSCDMELVRPPTIGDNLLLVDEPIPGDRIAFLIGD